MRDTGIYLLMQTQRKSPWQEAGGKEVNVIKLADNGDNSVVASLIAT